MKCSEKLAPDLQNQFRTALIDGIDQLFKAKYLSASLQQAAKYMVASGGKLIRPRITLSLAYDLGCDWQLLIRPALALELIHVSSLIHDDLPAIDNDDYRRGQLSCHKKFGEGVALLAGDVLIPIAFNQILQSTLTHSQKNLLSSTLSHAFIDLCSGQCFDLQGSTQINRETLVRLKTGALFSAAAKFGITLCEPNTDALRVADEFGLVLGEYFQLIDDYLDVYGTDSTRGRRESSDQRNRKITPFSLDIGQVGDRSNLNQLMEPTMTQLQKLLAELARCQQQPGNVFVETCLVIEEIRLRVA